MWEAMDIKAAYRRVLSGGPVYHAFVLLFALLLVVGISAGIHALFIAGSRHAYGTTREIPLAILISTYIFFAVASTGLCIVSSIGHVFGVRDFMPIARRAVLLSIITILSGFLVIGLEIENPFRMAVYNVLSPNLTSNIWWMGTLYSIFLILMSIEFVFLMLHRHDVSAKTGLLGVISDVAAISVLGGIFGMLQGREFWYGPYLQLYLVASAVVTGCAFILFFVILAHRINRTAIDAPTGRALEVVSKLAVLMLVVVMFFTVWKMLTAAVGGPANREAFSAVISGPFAFKFWVFEITGGLVLPFVLLLLSGGKKIRQMFVAATVMIFSIFFTRLDMVVVGQIVPLYLELGVKEFAGLHTYTPSLHEILVVLGGFGFCGLAFLLGEKIFDGFQEPHGHREDDETATDAVRVEETS